MPDNPAGLPGPREHEERYPSHRAMDRLAAGLPTGSERETLRARLLAIQGMPSWWTPGQEVGLTSAAWHSILEAAQEAAALLATGERAATLTPVRVAAMDADREAVERLSRLVGRMGGFLNRLQSHVPDEGVRAELVLAQAACDEALTETDYRLLGAVRALAGSSPSNEPKPPVNPYRANRQFERMIDPLLHSAPEPAGSKREIRIADALRDAIQKGIAYGRGEIPLSDLPSIHRVAEALATGEPEQDDASLSLADFLMEQYGHGDEDATLREYIAQWRLLAGASPSETPPQDGRLHCRFCGYAWTPMYSTFHGRTFTAEDYGACPSCRESFVAAPVPQEPQPARDIIADWNASMRRGYFSRHIERGEP